MSTPRTPLGSYGTNHSETSEPDPVKSDGKSNGQTSHTRVDDANAAAKLLPDKRAKDQIFKTASLYVSALTMGLCTPILGSTLVHLEYFFDVTTSTIAFSLTMQSLGGLFGSLLCGFVFDRVNHEMAFVVASLIGALSTMLAPNIGGLVPFMIAICIQSTAIGFVGACGQSYCVRLWQGHRYRDPILHTWHAVYSLGAMMSPFIIIPFLVDLPQHQSESSSSYWPTEPLFNAYEDYWKTSHSSTGEPRRRSSWNHTSVNISSSPLDFSISGLEKVRYAYVTIGLMTLAGFVLFLVIYLRARDKDQDVSSGTASQSLTGATDLKAKETNVDDTSAEHSAEKGSESRLGDIPICEDSKRRDRKLYFIFLLQVFFFYHLYRYGLTIPPMYLTVFAIKYLKFPVERAALLVSLFFTFQFIGRAIGVPVAAFIHPIKMMIFNVTSTAVIFVVLLAVIKVWPTIIWITIPLASFTMATTFAAGMLWISDRITITGRISSLILVGHTSGAITGPLIVGQLFERSTPMWFAYSLAASSIIVVVLLIVLIFYDRRYGDRVIIHANADRHGNGDDAVTVRSGKKSGYNTVNNTDDRLELTSSMERNESEES